MISNNAMSDSELEAWRHIRARGRGLFVAKIILRRCLWFSLPVAATLLLTGLRSKHEGGFWSEYQALLWIFAGATLIIGFGDGLFLWKMRERNFQRKLRAEDSSATDFSSRSRTSREAEAISSGNAWN